MACVAVMLGVALAFAVHLINQSALGEFSAAVRSLNGEPDAQLRALQGPLDEAWLGRVARQPGVAAASPVIELSTYARRPEGPRVALRLIGLDPLLAPALSPDLVPRLAEGQDRLALLAPDTVSLNGSARQALGVRPGETVEVQHGLAWRRLLVVGDVAAAGPPVAVMDIAGAQWQFDRLGGLSRIDLRLEPGVALATVVRELALPAPLQVHTPDQAAQRVSNISRAYRVNLTVLALVALFTGAFLVFSVMSLSVAKRVPQLALLGVLGLDARQRLRLVLAEAAVLGGLGSALGLALGTGLAASALALLSGDLGGGYFPGVAPRLQWSPGAALAYGALGVAAALAGSWLPARMAQRLAPAEGLKGLGLATSGAPRPHLGLALILVGALAALLPPVAGLPLFAYLAVAAVLLGGMACVAPVVRGLTRLGLPLVRRHAGGLLALQRARHQSHTATVAVAGVVASLSLAVALTTMVASFRSSVSVWLDAVLPADLYARTAGSAAAAESAFLDPAFVDAVRGVPGVARLDTLRLQSLQLDPRRPSVTLIARPLDRPEQALPLTGELRPARAGAVSSYVSEAMADLYGARPGTWLELPLAPQQPAVRTWVRGLWRDYARQHGSVVIDSRDFQRLSGDVRVNDLALWLDEGARTGEVQAAIRALAPDPDGLEFAEPREIRALSLRIFDRSFAVTYWLQAVAIAIGLFGVAASFSAQVLARRKEFGLLQHLGFTRRQVLGIVAGEGLVWSGAGALLGLALGIGVSVILVHVVNPQSFHWTMDLLLPWSRLTLLAAAMVAAGLLTAMMAGRAAASREAVLAVKEDW
ncbi:ABC transporter permease [Caldimonas caldifontis]|uniref:ABC transporter permease n=2 Tax=Caldimonas caldifontis TaxID=1452508 RepID=A0A2S5SW32_9BURK|nr:ABC transporter permease [Caldimonas caldifontis]